MINVTKSFFPKLEDFNFQVKRIWDNHWLTNNGQLYKELSFKLKDYLGVKDIIPMTNGTLPIQISLNAIASKGEVITTPFSYVATTSCIVWENCTPVFVDIDRNYLTIDENKIENLINEKTTCILATHVYGNPCNIEVIDKISKKYSLKVIYDAAHCFGVNYKGKSIFNYGDISTCSFHATKLFHTGEGGALFCNDDKLKNEVWYRHNFGHDGPENYFGLGINAKMSEIQAAMGLAVFPYINEILEKRKKICDLYDDQLNFNLLRKLMIRDNTDWNYSYYPVIFKDESILLKIKNELEMNNIFCRRYFYPSLEELPYVESDQCPIAKDISSRVLCLPLHTYLKLDDVKKISKIINNLL